MVKNASVGASSRNVEVAHGRHGKPQDPGTKGRRAQWTKGPAATTVQRDRVIRVHPCASVVKKTRSDSGLHHDPAGLELKTGKAGKGIGPASFVAIRVYSWFHHAERFSGGTTKHAKRSKAAGD